MEKYRLAVDENGSPFVLNSTYLLEKGAMYHNTLFIALSKEGEYWKIISGGVFRMRYSKYKKIIYSASEVPTSSPVEDDPLPFEEGI